MPKELPIENRSLGYLNETGRGQNPLRDSFGFKNIDTKSGLLLSIML